MKTSRLILAAFVTALALLHGCGGGSDDCTTNPPAPREEAQWRQACPVE